MTDPRRDDWLDLGLPRRPLPLLTPPPDGFAAAMHHARRRRWRTAGTTAALSTVLVAGLAWSVLGGTPVEQDARIGFTTPQRDRDEQPGSSVVEQRPADGTTGPDTSSSGPALSVGPGAAGTAPGSTGQGSGGPGAVAPTTGPDPAVVAPTPTAPADPGTAPRPRVRREQTGAPPTCAADLDGDRGTRVGGGWCLVPAAVLASDQNVVTLSMSVCRNAPSASWLTFPTDQQVDFVVSQQSATLWTWSRGQQFARRQSSLLTPYNECWEWAVDWDQTDEQGRLVDPGAYTLSVTSPADELAGMGRTTIDFQIS